MMSSNPFLACFKPHPHETWSKKITIEMPRDIVAGALLLKTTAAATTTQNTKQNKTENNKNIYKIQRLSSGEASPLLVCLPPLCLDTAHHLHFLWDHLHIPYLHMSCDIWNLKTCVYKLRMVFNKNLANIYFSFPSRSMLASRVLGWQGLRDVPWTGSWGAFPWRFHASLMFRPWPWEKNQPPAIWGSRGAPNNSPSFVPAND